MTRAITCSPDSAPEDRLAKTDPSAPSLPAHREDPAVRARARATSYVTAPASEPLAPDDPLLGFAPYIHSAPRKNSITPDRQRKFIAHLAATGIVKQAAKHIGASLEALYKLRSKAGAEGFAAAWDAAVDRGVSRLEDCALARAIAGEERMVVSSGKVLGTETRHNEALVMFFLKNRRKDTYAGSGAGTPSHTIVKGHPVYERIRRELENERWQAEGDRETRRKRHEKLARQFEVIKERMAHELAARFNAEIAQWMAEHPGKVPVIRPDFSLAASDAREPESAGS